MKEMVKIEKQLYKTETENVTLVMPDGKRQASVQEKKVPSGTEVYEVEKAYYEKYLKNNKMYKLADGKAKSSDSDEEKARIKAEKEAEKAAKEAEKAAKEAAKNKKDGEK